MATDISKVNNVVVITFASGRKRRFYNPVTNIYFRANNDLILTINNKTLDPIPLTDLRVSGSGSAPANVGAAETALDAVFPDANSSSGGSGADTVDSITYASTTDLNLDGNKNATLVLTGNVTFTTSNKGAGKSKAVRITGGASSRNYTFPAGWIFIGNSAPSSLAANKTAILSLYCYGSNDSDIVASYAVQL